MTHLLGPILTLIPNHPASLSPQLKTWRGNENGPEREAGAGSDATCAHIAVYARSAPLSICGMSTAYGRQMMIMIISRCGTAVYPLGHGSITIRPMGTRCDVYVIGPAGGPWKVGRALDAVKRRAQLQTASPLRLEIMHVRTVPVGEAGIVETNAHRALSSTRVGGEWFSCAVEQAIAAVDDAPVSLLPAPPRKSVRIRYSPSEIRNIRRTTGLTREEFACVYGLRVAALAEWEVGRRSPPNHCHVLLRVIEKRPDAVLEALSA